ncbi:MAG TPA: RedB protein [Candidatus Eisenbacteria bacterium]|nr:RedB protein [Candidatus Eisenbacteria bacterium]
MSRRDVGFVSLAVVWLIVVVGGMAYTWRYKTIPGRAATAPERWPAASELQRSSERATLVLLAHPRCPCSRASIAELARLHAVIGSRVRTIVLFLRPDGMSEGWERSDLWSRAAEIPGVMVVADADGREARVFGTHTSGEVLDYDRSGTLAYSGGITGARGHEGTSAGFRTIVSLARGQRVDRREAPVFGCSLDTRPPEVKGRT